LVTLAEAAEWAKVKFRPKQIKLLDRKKGRATKQFKLKIEDEISSITENPIKYLGGML
jgi:hypothetical protein